MKASIRALDKKYLPHPVTGEPALHVFAGVDFLDDAGKIVHSQEYAHLPEDADPEYYQRQADVMQSDLDLTKRWAEEAARKAAEEAPADAAIERIRQRHKLEFHEEIPIHDVKNPNAPVRLD
jgi:hypothetical protein